MSTSATTPAARRHWLPRLLTWMSRNGDWHSWDDHPWRHPWLTRSNLQRAKAFSRGFLEREKRILERVDVRKLKIGFCGNIANAMYMRAAGLRREGLDVDIYLHPDDRFVMSYPAWEEFRGTIDDSSRSFDELKLAGVPFPEVPGVHQLPNFERWPERYRQSGMRFLRFGDVTRFSPYLSVIDTLIDLQSKDVLWATQVPYLAYLANRPYLVSQMGGEFWFEASRNDVLGRLMRRTFSAARLNLASQPWVFSNARRYGMRNVIYLPKTIDESIYAPGPGSLRAEWQARSGGEFFVLTSSRLDERNKGSSVGIGGFAQFARAHPDARLVFLGWGTDMPALERRLTDLGVRGQAIQLPVAGKAYLREVLRSADVFLDQFVLGYYGSAGMEAMACGRVVIARNEREQYDALCETGAPPILNATAPAEVAAHLEMLKSHPERRRELEQATRQWILDNHSAGRWHPEISAVLAATAMRENADMQDNPLNDPLSAEERLYHLRGWLNAPPYPSYGY